MARNAYVICLLVPIVAALTGCSSGPASKAPAKAAPDKIQGESQVLLTETTAADTALNADGPSVYLIDGLHRYRLFFNKSTPVEAGKEYIAEGVYAQKAIDAMGDPDQGKNGYPLQASCDHVIRTTWPGMAFDVTDADSTALCEKVKRYPARPVFLVTKLTEVTSEEKKPAAAEKEPLEVSVPADKQRAMLISGPASLPAPLWAPEGGTVNCKVEIDEKGKIAELDTGAQLCESVDWSQFSYKPTLKGGKPAQVNTEVAVKFDPRK
jgi:hypothetical protein